MSVLKDVGLVEGIKNFSTVLELAFPRISSAITAFSTAFSGSSGGLFSSLAAGATAAASAISPLTLAIGGVTAALGIGYAAYSIYRSSIDEAVNSAKKAGSEWESNTTTLQEQVDRITELREALSSGTLTEQEAADAKNELLSIQESLSESYGKQVAGIDLINGSLTEQIALLGKVSEKQAEQFQNENKKGIKEAEKQIEKKRHTYLGQFYDNGSDESEAIKKTIKNLQDKYGKDVFTTGLGSDGITMDVHFKADASTAKEALNDFMTDISDIEKQYGESDILDLMSDNASAGLSKANDVLTEYGDLYKQAQQAKLVADEDLFKAPSGKEQTETCQSFLTMIVLHCQQPRIVWMLV